MNTHFNHLTLTIVAVLLVAAIAGGTYALLNQFKPIDSLQNANTNAAVTQPEQENAATTDAGAASTTLRGVIIETQENQLRITVQNPSSDQPNEITAQYTSSTTFDSVDTGNLPRPGSGQTTQPTPIEKNALATGDVVNVETQDAVLATSTVVIATRITQLK